MAAFLKVITPSLASKLPCNAHRIGPLVSNDAIKAGDACYINADGMAYRATGAAANAAALVDGFATIDAAAGRPITLYHDVDLAYGPGSATTGARLFLSGTVAGGLDTAASTGGLLAIATVVEINSHAATPHAVLRVTRNR